MFVSTTPQKLLAHLAVIAAVLQQCLADTEDPCVPLPDCEPVMELFRMRNSIPGLSRADVFRQIKELSCDFVGQTPHVRCRNQDLDDDDGGVNDLEPVEESEIQARTSLSGMNFQNDPRNCVGSLKMSYYNRDNLGDLKTLRLRKQTYRSLRTFTRHPRRFVINTLVLGNCCWEMAERERFSGGRQYMGLGSSGAPQVQPKSARKVVCSLNK